MSVVPVVGRAVAKIPRNMALHCVKTSSLRPLGPIRTMQDRGNMAKSISGTAAVHPIIPTVEVQHESEIPSADVLSRLNIFDIWREETRTRETANGLISGQMRDAQKARRQQALGSSPTINDGGSVTPIAIRETIEENGASQEDLEQEEHGTVI